MFKPELGLFCQWLVHLNIEVAPCAEVMVVVVRVIEATGDSSNAGGGGDMAVVVVEIACLSVFTSVGAVVIRLSLLAAALCEVGTGLRTMGWCEREDTVALASLAGAKTFPCGCFKRTLGGIGVCCNGGGDMGGENVIGELNPE